MAFALVLPCEALVALNISSFYIVVYLKLNTLEAFKLLQKMFLVL